MTDLHYSLTDVAAEARANSQRWFPAVHDPTQAAAPLLVHYALGLAGEAGEVANLVKKALRAWQDGLRPDQDALGDELADVFIYLLLCADEANVDLMGAYRRKMAICEGRWGTGAGAGGAP